MFNLYHLKYFYDSIKLGSLTASAVHNHISRPGVSQAIKSLESQLDASLLVHKKNGFKLTHQGKWLYKECQSIFNHVNDISLGIKGAKEKPAGMLRVGYSRSLAQFLLSKSIQVFESKYPEVNMNIKLGTSKELLDSLNKNQIDAALIIGESGNELNSTEIGTGHFVCITSTANRFPKRFIITEERTETLALKRKLKKTIKEATFLQIESWDLIYNLTLEGFGIGLVPDFMIESRPVKSIKVLREYSAFAPYTINLVHRDLDVNTSALISSLA